MAKTMKEEVRALRGHLQAISKLEMDPAEQKVLLTRLLDALEPLEWRINCELSSMQRKSSTTLHAQWTKRREAYMKPPAKKTPPNTKAPKAKPERITMLEAQIAMAGLRRRLISPAGGLLMVDV